MERWSLAAPAVEATLAKLVARGDVIAGEFRPSARGREHCHPEVLRMLRRRSLAALRREVESVPPDALARFLPAWHGVGARASGVDRLLEVVFQLQGAALPASVIERDVIADRVANYNPRLLDELVSMGEVVWVGRGSLGTSDGRVWLNGEPFVQRLVLDQGYFPDGLLTAPSDDALRADIEAAKALGFNGARKHQKVEDPRWLYWADRLGFLVWDEMPSFQEHSGEAERRLAAEWTEVVRRDRDHPCVVAWVPANESFGLEHIEPPVRSRFLVRLYDLTHELDGSRPVVSNDGWEHAVTDLCNLHDYSGPDDFARRYRSLELILDGQASGHQPYDPGFAYRGEPLLVTEFGTQNFDARRP